MKCAVFFDRDGVLNEAIVRDRKPFPPASIDDVRFVRGARESVSILRSFGFLAICVTNQPDVARGGLDRATADAINRHIARELNLDDIIACFHDDDDQCTCRKPKPGMIEQAAVKWSVDLKSSYVVGDRWRDIDAGAAAGCRTVLIDHSYAERTPESEPNARLGTPLEAANWILDNFRRHI